MLALREALQRNAARHPQRAALTDGRIALTARETAEQAFALARHMQNLPRTLGLFAESGPGFAIAQMAGALAGKTIVPLPTFFSAAQQAHIARDAGIETLLVTEATIAAAQASGLPKDIIRLDRPPEEAPALVEDFRQIIYTSGSTGAPKGVVHGAAQIGWSATSLASAIEARDSDLHLSVLPLSLLLEAICAIFVPTLAGARVHFATNIAEGLAQGRLRGLADAFEAVRPTTSVVVPQVLDAWCAELNATGRRAPDSLRFVAIGGAAVSAKKVAVAEHFGIPAFEGYGLSECCSVVAVNTPQAQRAGTAGRPLPGLDVAIVDGEIVVEGPSVMDGYLGAPALSGPWKTGDLGHFDKDGFLVVDGRKDNLIVTPNGRNISPEWVEATILDRVPLAACALVANVAGALAALAIAPAPAPDAPGIAAALFGACSPLPAYARPGACLVLPASEAMAEGLFTSNGRVRRARAAALVQERADHLVVSPTNDQHGQTA